MTDKAVAFDYADTLEAQLLCDYVAGGETMIDACRILQVPVSTTYDRLRRSTRFAEMMEPARAAGYDVMANDLMLIARGTPGIRGSTGDVKRDRLLIHTIEKLLAKWDPARYGEKLQVETKNANVAIPVGDDPIAATRAYEALMKGS